MSPLKRNVKRAHRGRRRKKGGRSRPAASGWRRYLTWRNAGWAVLGLFVAAAMYTAYLDVTLRAQFDGKRWSLPARVYARPLELYPGRPLTPGRLVRELTGLGYHQRPNPVAPGSYRRDGDRVDMVTRDFVFWDGPEPSQALSVVFSQGRIKSVRGDGAKALSLVRLDPRYIGGIYPAHHMEDRVLVRLADVPPVMVKGLIAVEDRHFYTHHGLDFRAIGRALLADLRAGKVVQGGSTLTQQLVKNYFLTNRRSLWRKANEAVMAVLLELHYSKDEILQAYLNEVYMGQEGQRAIHGVGLASRFYFDRDIGELRLPQIALMVGLVRGPSYYDPRNHPRRALARRNRVLDIMAEQGVIDADEARRAKRAPLGVVPEVTSGITRYPAFLDLVERQLRRDYRDEDLRSEGLRVFTTLDPLIQHDVERAVSRDVARLERDRGLSRDSLQGAAVVTSPSSGEVLALVSDRRPQYPGFNRALDATRPIGSLVKPAVYLTALAEPKRFNLLTKLDDAPLSVKQPNGTVWSPSNYEHESHGEVPMYAALAHSYNQASVRLGLDVGVDKVVDTLHRLGIEQPLKPYPSLLLGAAPMTPFEISQMYQTLAAGGFRTPLRAIREVTTAEGQPLQRYPLQVAQAFDPATVAVLDSALRNVPRIGTARSLQDAIPPQVGVAGKTGTTNDLRDSWFAGFTEQYLAVVWLGADDNRPVNLTGATGALRVWTDFMERLPLEPYTPTPVEGVEQVSIDPHSGLLAGPGCSDALPLAFIKGTAPTDYAPCAGNALHRTFEWFKQLFK